MDLPRDILYSQASCEQCGSSKLLERQGDQDVLPGEEDLHERLQWQLIDSLHRSHQSWGLVVQIEVKIKKASSGDDVHALFRSIEAAPGHYSCELLELCPTDGSAVENRFFTVVPPDERRSRASVVVLAKVAALVGRHDVRPLLGGQFDAIARSADCSFG